MNKNIALMAAITSALVAEAVKPPRVLDDIAPPPAPAKPKGGNPAGSKYRRRRQRGKQLFHI